MCVPGQILEDVFGPSEGGPDLDHPFWFLEGPQEMVESFRPLEPLKLPGHAELFTAICGGEMCEKFPAKHFAQHGARKKEPVAAADPGRSVRREAAGWNQTM